MGSTGLPKKYKAIVYDKPGSISTKIEELDMPEPGPGEVLINLYVWLTHNTLHQCSSCYTNKSSVHTRASATLIWAS
jgi:D-arabinose 1-dehydrogenase-like Zn-dependent alcohol dehydrogenase